MDEKQLQSLIENYRNGTLSAKDKAILESWYNQQAKNYHSKLTDEALDRNLKSVAARLPLKYPARTSKSWPRIAAAASIAVLMVAGIFYYQHRSKQQLDSQAKQQIGPGGNKAFLTLANGKKISLTDAENGAIANEAGIMITKNADGQLTYAAIPDKNNASNTYNMIETPKGGQYQIRLPDGTDVWLNANSQLRFPTSFKARAERRVELSGEAYFQVAKDRTHPFIVRSSSMNIKVLGTHFNVSNYKEEATSTTTLLEGAVQLNGKLVLKPGEQAVSVSSGKILVSQVDVSEAVAWKNGKFIFSDENIESIMRKLARWYNVEVIYEGQPSKETFTASISRFADIHKVLDKLSYTNNVHFKIEGRRITVMK